MISERFPGPHLCPITQGVCSIETGCNNGASTGHRGEVKSSQQQQQHEEIRTENENKRMAFRKRGRALHSFDQV